MKEQGVIFTEEQKELLKEISKLEGYEERPLYDPRKKLTVSMRMKIVDKIREKYSMLNKDNDIFSAQIFSAMEEYLKECDSTGYRYEGL